MTIKDKIAIGLIILTIILFGIAMNGQAYDIKDINLDDMAVKAANDANGFMNISVNDWVNKTISPGNYKHGYYKSCACMYHVQSNNGISSYKITDILDFEFDGQGINLRRNGQLINTNDYTGALASAIFTAYNSGDYYNEEGWGGSSLKTNMIKAFSQAAQEGGVEATSVFYTNIREDDKYLLNSGAAYNDLNYGKTAKSYKSLTKNSKDSDITVKHERDYTIIGPFNINYAVKGIEKIQIKTDEKDGTWKSNDEIYYSTNFNNTYYEWIQDISRIPSGTNFYIKIQDKAAEFAKGNNMKVTFYQTGMEYYKARLVLALNPQATGQNLGVFAAEQKSYTGQLTYDISKQEPIDLTVVKSGNDSIKQANVKFYLRKDGDKTTYAKWENKSEQNGIVKYSNITFMDYVDTSSAEIAEKYVFMTGTSGKFVLENLDTSYIYSFQEFNNPNQGYSTIDIKDATLSNGVASVSLANTDSNNKDTKNLVNGIKLSSTQSNTLEIIDKVKEEPIDLTVVKLGNDSIKQANVKFYLRKEGTQTTYAKWGKRENQDGITIYSDITFINYIDTSSSDKAEKHVFITDKTGKFVIENLDVSYTYSLQEINNPNEGYEKVDIRKASLDNGVADVSLSNTDSKNKTTKNLVKDIKLSATKNNVLEITDKTDKLEQFDLNINKVNTSGTKISGAEFKLKVYKDNKEYGWLYYDIDKEEFDYNNKYNKSTTWSSSTGKDKEYNVYADKTGEIEILGLSIDYEYEIYEFKPATNYYDLDEQIDKGMKVTIDNKNVSGIKYISEKDGVDESIYCGTVSYDENGSSVTVKVTNVKKTSGGGGGSSNYLYISGLIWEDKTVKNDEYNNIYDSDYESLHKKSVKVSLMSSSGAVKKTTTTKTGEYNLSTGISIKSSTSKEDVAEKLKGYYLKLEYTDEYSTVAPEFKERNGSKALTQDKDGVAFIYNLSDYVDLFYEYKTLEHMNIGLIKTQENAYQVNQSIAYVKVVMNGYTYKYEYGGTGDTSKTAAPTVNFERGNAYTRAIYPSDIAYSNANNWNKDSLSVYVVYRIDIVNNETRNYGKKKSDARRNGETISYVEVDLKVTSLVDKYDKDRYELDTEYDVKNNKDFGDWKNKNGEATYTGNKLDDGLAPKKPLIVYIQFKVKKQALLDLLDRKEIYENEPTEVTTKAYHNYWRSYWSGDEEPVLKIQDRKTATTTLKAKSNYLKLSIDTERTITGTVYEDENVYQNGEILGDSMFGKKKDGSNENTISNVKVELISESGDIAKLYYNKDNKYIEEEATKISATDGTYSFVGVTPGKYYVRFTYGDGTQKIIKPDGNENGKITLENYKSTIVTDGCIQSALGYEFKDKFNAGEEWYKHDKHPNDSVNKIYSTAVDNLEQRAEYNKDKKSRKNIEASTALMSISVENTIKDYATITKSNNGTKEIIMGINLGIIEVPEVSMSFDKVVSYIQIINSQGNILAEGNPATKNINYVSDLDKQQHLVAGSQYTKSEINEKELYGSKLKVTYSITVQNNSEVNYYEKDGLNSKYYGYYYKFGDNSTVDSREVTITVDSVLDYIDPVIKYENISIDDKHEIAKVKASDNIDITNKIKNKTKLKYDYVVDITKWKELNTTKNKDKNYSIDKTQDTAELTITRLLSIDDDDLGVSNVAQVKEIHVTNKPDLVETIDVSERYFNDSTYVNPTEEVYVVITPPTGEDTLTTTMYIITAIVSLSIMIGGIVLIKKKVLHK